MAGRPGPGGHGLAGLEVPAHRAVRADDGRGVALAHVEVEPVSTATGEQHRDILHRWLVAGLQAGGDQARHHLGDDARGATGERLDAPRRGDAELLIDLALGAADDCVVGHGRPVHILKGVRPERTTETLCPLSMSAAAAANAACAVLHMRAVLRE